MAVVLDYLFNLKTKQAEQNAKLTKEEVRKLKEELAKAKAEARETSRSMTQLGGRGGAMSRASRAASMLGGRVGRLSGALGRVSPALADAAIFTTEMADATEVLSGGGASLLRILGPVAIAVGVLGGAYMVLNAELKEAEALQKTAATNAEAMAAIHLKVRDAVLQRQLAEGEISQAEFNRISAAKTAADLFRAQKEQAQERIDLLKAEREELERLAPAEQKRAEANARSPLYAGDDLIGGGAAPVSIAREDAKQAAAEAKASVKSLNAEIKQHEALLVTADKALANLSAGETRLADELTRTANAGIKANAAIEDITGTLGDTGGMIDALGGVSDAVSEAFSTEDIEAWGDALVASMERAFIMQRRLERTQTAASLLSTGGDPLALMSMAGPYGAAASTALGGLASLGGMSDEDLDAMFSGLSDDILSGIERLPELLVHLIPEFAVALATELPAALGSMLNELIVAMAKAIGDALNPTKGDNFLDKITKGLEEGVENLLNWDGEIMIREGGLFGGSRASGGTIPRDGMYLLHAGEEILRSNGVGTNGSMSGGMREMLLRLQMTTPGMLPTVQALDIATGPGGPWEGT